VYYSRKKSIVLILVLLCILTISGCQSFVNNRSEYIDPNSKNLSESIKGALLKNKKLILSVGTGLCENCKIVENTLLEFKKEKPDNLEVIIFTEYTDTNTFQILGVTVSPTTLLIDENHKVVRRIIGPFTVNELKSYLEEADWEKY
jgi:thiol-disulfide isomerase/thioredoxin